MYQVTALKLKQLDPSLRVGGPAIVGSLPFLQGFLQYNRDHQVPVDFVSWHIYTREPQEVVDRALQVHGLMAICGFAEAESILDEWNYAPAQWSKVFSEAAAGRKYFTDTHSSIGAAFDTTVMIKLQDAPVDIATFFSGTTFM